MMSQDNQRLARCVRRLEELHAWRNAREHPIEEWMFTTSRDVAYTLTLGEHWPVVDLPVQLTAETAIPREWAGEPVEIELWLGGEGYLRLSTGVEGGLNPFH